MKKVFFGIVMIIAMTVTVTTSCSKEGCAALALDALEKFEAIDDPESCNAYKTAQQKYIDNCLTGETKEAAQDELDTYCLL